MILVIGNLRVWELEGRVVPEVDGFRFASFDELDAALLNDLAPDLVLSQLIGLDFDALDLARRLEELGYRRTYRAVAHAMPNAAAIREEVQSAAPGVEFDLVVVSPASPSRA